MNNINNTNTKAFEIKDEELNLVNGGYKLVGEQYDNPGDVVFKFSVGDHVELVTLYIWRAFTKGCTITSRKIAKSSGGNGYSAWYKVSCDSWLYDGEWYEEKNFEGGFIQCIMAECC